jgi:hypothetical protein
MGLFFYGLDRHCVGPVGPQSNFLHRGQPGPARSVSSQCGPACGKPGPFSRLKALFHGSLYRNDNHQPYFHVKFLSQSDSSEKSSEFAHGFFNNAFFGRFQLVSALDVASEYE